MTPKVSSPPAAIPAQGQRGDSKSLKSQNFNAILLQLSAALVSGPVEGSGRPARPRAEGVGDGFGPFSRDGTSPERVEGDAPSALVDALELSLSRPPVTAARAEVARSPNGAIDAVHVAALERIVERLSFGSDRRAAMARLELGGIWAGAVLVVRASGRDVELQLECAGGHVAQRELAERLAARLRSRGFATALSFS